MLQRAIKRDGNFCKACKSKDDLTLDHIIPISAGGSKRAAYNHQVLCSYCNNIKDNLMPGPTLDWWPDCLLGYLKGGKIKYNASKMRYEDDLATTTT
jgi:hypothetical protein